MNPSQRNLLVGTLFGMSIMILAYYFRNGLSENAPPFLIGFLTCLIIIIGLAAFAALFYEKQIRKFLVGEPEEDNGNDENIKTTFKNLAQKYLPESNPQEIETLARYFQMFSWGRAVYATLGVIASIFIALGGILGSVLIFKQNSLLETQTEKIIEQTDLLAAQNQKFDIQNKRLSLQNNLIEAERRSSLVFLMSNILDKVDEEIKVQYQEGRSKKFRLSQPLVSRIVALSKAFRPYRMMEGDTLSEKLVSPERGQLFIALMENNLDSLTQNTIVADGDFSYAVIGKINLKGAMLVNARLERVDLYEANLDKANLLKANLEGANLEGANLNEANLSTTNLDEANLYRASLINADIRAAKLHGASLIAANLDRANLRGAFLSEINFAEAYLNRTNFSGAYLNEATNVVKHQIVLARTLYLTKGLDSTLKIELQLEKPCLFKKVERDRKIQKYIYPCDNNNSPW